MARIARLVVPGIPHHVTQRGSRRQPVFFCSEDYDTYRTLIAAACTKAGVEIWSYCLMPNHIHLIAVPTTADGLRAALADAHRRYAQSINAREGWRGHLWQERFASFPMDDAHLHAAARYVELNPVRAGLAAQAWDYSWSSARAHVHDVPDPLVQAAPLRAHIGDAASWRAYLSLTLAEEETDRLRRHAGTGRPLGPKAFVQSLEEKTGRALAPKKRGPKAAATRETDTLELGL